MKNIYFLNKKFGKILVNIFLILFFIKLFQKEVSQTEFILFILIYSVYIEKESKKIEDYYKKRESFLNPLIKAVSQIEENISNIGEAFIQKFKAYEFNHMLECCSKKEKVEIYFPFYETGILFKKEENTG